MNLSDCLNEQQLSAVLHEEGPISVFACAGSGKTRVITYRIARLISDLGVSPSSILACTFTNKAANEMKGRVSDSIAQKANGLWIGTFHSICFRILRREASHLGYKPGFTILDTEDSLAVVKGIVRGMNIDKRAINPRFVRNAISSAKNAMINEDQYAQTARTQKSVIVSSVYKRYQREIEEMNAMDFDDLISKTLKLFTFYSGVLDKYQNQFEYYLVDEYQDINPSQHQLIKLLAGNGKMNIMIVGDDDQSIYAFRGATPGIMLDFKTDFPGTKMVKLDINYRSTSSVLSVAHQLVSKNKRRVKKNLVAHAGEGLKVSLYRGMEPSDESYQVAREIQKGHENDNRKYSDYAIIYRTNAQSRTFEEALISRAIPYQLIGGIRFYQRKEIKDLLAYLRFVVNPADHQSFKRAILYPRRGIGYSTINKLDLISREFKLTHDKALAHLIENNALNSSATTNARHFLNLINELKVLADTEPAHKVIEKLIERLDIISVLRSSDTEEDESRAENVEEFLNLSTEFMGFTDEEGLEAFLASVSLIADIDQSNTNADKVLMTTIHQVKGLEFPVVFLCGLEEGTLPHIRSIDTESDIEEERRLAYVGMTRAKEMLHLSYVTNRHIHGIPKVCTPSRFVKEIKDNEHIETIGLSGSIKTDGTIPSIGRKRFKKKEPVVVNKGDIVNHRAWGTGKVISVDGENAEVEFSSVGPKLLNLRYAPISRE
jgi:DNA helicase II / ATP-dependent DNA helicase PcrA